MLHLLVATVLTHAPGPDAMTLSASMPGALRQNGPNTITVTIDIDEAWSASGAGMPQPLLQIEAPDSVELTGRRLTEYRELSRNEFLMLPLERLAGPGTAEIEFTLAAPAAGETIAINAMAYVRGEGDEAWFVRRRIELPLAPGAEASSGEQAPVSDWGDDQSPELLQIGDAAPAFTLPRADGTTLSLGDYLGKTSILIVTYRAFW